jgi:N-acetylglucosamine-6-sulfatase
MLASVDEGVGKIFKVLEAGKQLENTLIIFTSDESYFYGEHGLSVERRLAYEESARIPLVMRFPNIIKPASTIHQLVLNLDIAPTLLEFGGAAIPATIHGKSLVPLLKGEKVPWRDAFLIEYYSDKVFPRMLNMGYQAVRTERWKYIHYVDLQGMDELYDLKADPYEMRNLIAEKKSQKSLRELQATREKLLETTK